MNLSSLTPIIKNNIENPRKATRLLATAKASAGELFRYVNDNEKSLMFFNTKAKQIVETQNVFSDSNKIANYHGIPVKSGVIKYVHDTFKTAFMLFDNGFVVERKITKNPKKGYMQVETALRHMKDQANEILSFKRKTIYFKTDGKKFLRHEGTSVQSFDAPRVHGFHTADNPTLMFDTLFHPKKYTPIKKMSEARKIADKLELDEIIDTKPTQFRKGILKALDNPSQNTTSLHEAIFKSKEISAFTLVEQRFGGQTLGLQTLAGKVVETWNVFNRNLKPNYHGIPASESIALFEKHTNKTLKTFIDSRKVVDRIVVKDAKTGVMSVHTTLSEFVDGVYKVKSQIQKLLKFEVKNGKFKKLLSKKVNIEDYNGYKGFANAHTKGAKSLSFWDTRTTHNETSGQKMLQELTQNAGKTKTNPEILKEIVSSLKTFENTTISAS